MSIGLNGHRPEGHRPPPPDCSRYAEALPRLRAGLLSAAEREDLRRHVATCATCHARRSADDEAALDAAVRRRYGVPAGRAPFLRLEDVLARAAQDADNDAPPATPTIRSTREIPFMRTDAPDSFGHATTTTASQAPRGPGRGKIAAALAAVAAIAALFALILHAAAPGSSVADKGSPTPTATPSALHYLGANGKWEFSTVDKGKQIGPLITVAPSDPRVMYKRATDGTLTVQQSNDGGKTWSVLHVPSDDVGDTQASVRVSISPLDAKTVFAIISSDPSNPNCPRPVYQGYSPTSTHSGALALLRPLSGGYSCTFEYVSTDGGATWQKTQTPEKGDVGESYPAPFQAQDGRLYSWLDPDINGPADQGYRLLVSTDAIHWQAADAPLFAKGLHVYEFAATPTGTTLFATTIPVDTNGGDATTHRQFWRSDDAGASWRNLGVFPNTGSDTQDSWLTAAALVDGKALIYYTTVQSQAAQGTPVPSYPEVSGPASGYMPTIHVSADDGHTWQTSPNAGLPAGQESSTPWQVGVLPDGTIAELFWTQTLQSNGPNSVGYHYSNPAIYGWKPGASSWSQLTPVISGEAIPGRAWLDQPTGTHPAGVRMLISYYDANSGYEAKLAYCQLTQ